MMNRGGQRARRVGAAAIVITGLVVTGLGACGGSTRPPDAGPRPGSNAAAAAAGSGDCQAASLDISTGQVAVGTGHQGVPLLFRNTGTTPCRLTGYPGVAGLTNGSAQTRATATPSGFLGGLPPGTSSLPVIELAPGEVASALVEGTDLPTGTATTCPSLTTLVVTPPNARQASRLPTGLPDCTGLAVHPVVPGTNGTLS